MKHLELIRNEHTNDYTIGTIGEIGKEPICFTKRSANAQTF